MISGILDSASVILGFKNLALDFVYYAPITSKFPSLFFKTKYSWAFSSIEMIAG